MKPEQRNTTIKSNGVEYKVTINKMDCFSALRLAPRIANLVIPAGVGMREHLQKQIKAGTLTAAKQAEKLDLVTMLPAFQASFRELSPDIAEELVLGLIGEVSIIKREPNVAAVKFSFADDTKENASLCFGSDVRGLVLVAWESVVLNFTSFFEELGLNFDTMTETTADQNTGSD